MNDTVLITGAGGFVGSAVTRLFVKSLSDTPPKFSDGSPVKHVVALLRPGGSLERLHELTEADHWSIEYADITNRSELRDLLGRICPRAILHLAADNAIYRDLPEAERYRTSIIPIETMFEELSGVPGARLVHTGSAWVLQPGERLNENARLEPRSAYAKNKAWVDQSLPAFHDKTGVNWINLRLFNIFGKYEHKARLLPYLVHCLTQGTVAELSHGDQIRDFNDLEVIAQAYLLALQADESACGKVYHIGSGCGMSLRDFAMTVAEVTGNAHLIRFGATQTQDQDIPCLVADPARARRILHWAPAGDLEVRIRRTVQWWLERLGKAVKVIQAGTS